jgi:zinc/manganese transport system permease protein
VVGVLLATGVAGRLLTGWGFGVAVSVLGLLASWTWDLPTGAAIVSTFGVLLGAVALVLGGRSTMRQVRSGGVRALAGIAATAAGLIGLAGVLLLTVPGMDHLWLDWLEEGVPGVRRLFLDADEREADAESRRAIDEGLVELNRARRIQQEAKWGARPVSSEMQERVRQYIAGRTEIITGDRMVLAALKQRARQRQRYLLGLPLAVMGIGTALGFARYRRRTGETAGRTMRRGDRNDDA